MVFTVEGSLLDELKKSADDLRRKDLFEFKSFSAQHVEVTYGGQTYAFDKPKAPEPAPGASPSPTPSPATDVWKQVKPAAKDVDQTKFNDFLTTLSNLRADKFADKAFTSGEEMTLSVKFGDTGTTEQMQFRKSGGVVHAIRTGDSGAAIVSTADYDKAIATLKEITAKK
jgi:hypothetical protein